MDGTQEEWEKHYVNDTLKHYHSKCGTKFDILGDAQFQKDCLEAHNALRTKYGLISLTWSQNLAEQAQQWATKLALEGHTLYLDAPGIGEAISFFPIKNRNKIPSGADVADAWASEAKTYNYQKPGWNANSKHFSQMIWRSTREFGVGRSLLSDGDKVVVVALYRPAGNSNYPGDFAKNVPENLLN